MNHASDLILIGSTLLLALAAHAVGQKVHVPPRVTLLLLLGALAGPDLLDLLPDNADQSFSLITQLTLAMVGFLLGERMSARDLRQGKEALIVSLAVTLLTAAAVILAVWAVTGNLPAALLLGGIATATAPAATLDVLREAGANGPLTRLVFQVVAIDDAWGGAILFSVLLVAAGLLLGNGDLSGPPTAMLHGLWEVAGSVLLGMVLGGFPMAWLTGRLRPGEPMLLESAGFVFVAAGLASWFGLSYLLTCMTLGIVVANRARHHVRPFRSIEGISEPFLALFFFMAGYQLDWLALPTRCAWPGLCTGPHWRPSGRGGISGWPARRLCSGNPAAYRRLPDAPPGRRCPGPRPGGHRTAAGAWLHSAAGDWRYGGIRVDRPADDAASAT